MHCPRCGQKQLSPETKFCNACGFQLALVTELLANGGYLPQLQQLQPQEGGRFRPLLNKKNGVFFAVMWFVFFSMLLSSVFAIMGGDEIVALTAVLGFFGSILIAAFSLVVLPSSRRSASAASFRPPAPVELYGNRAVGDLPAGTQIPAHAYAPPQQGSWRVPETGELSVPGSVTENTTKLLAKDQEK
jgi:hypothetical protein